MKPIWREIKIVQISSRLHEKYSCIAGECEKKNRCQVVIPINQEPPNTCEEVKNGSGAG